jgi:hypothetical protein
VSETAVGSSGVFRKLSEVHETFKGTPQDNRSIPTHPSLSARFFFIIGSDSDGSLLIDLFFPPSMNLKSTSSIAAAPSEMKSNYVHHMKS